MMTEQGKLVYIDITDMLIEIVSNNEELLRELSK